MPFQICRVCYERGHDLLSLENNQNHYLHKLSTCVPEIDIYIIDNPGICKKCARMLDIAYELRETCLKNEKRYNDKFNKEKRSNNTESTDVISRSIREPPSDAPILSSETNEAEVRIEGVTYLCEPCNKQFVSEHDRKVHEHRMHRYEKHLKKIRKLLPPITKSTSNISPMIVLDGELENESVNTTSNSQNSENISTTLSNNLNQSNESQSLSCKKCNITFTDACEFESHNLTHIENLCQICGKAFGTRNILSNHMKVHNTKCCHESFPTPTLLQLHTYKEHNMTCGICNEHFTEFSLLFHHLVDHMGDNWFKCNSCCKQFKTELDLKEHNCRSYKCIYCKTMFTSKKTYIVHMQNHKLAPVVTHKNVKCNKCNLSFSTRSDYMYHFQLEHITRAQNIQCKKCNKRFISRKECQLHMQSVHTKPQSIQCKKCNKIFATRRECQLHIHSVHKNEIKSSRLYTCQLCPQQFEGYNNLKLHMLQCHCNKELAIPIVDCRKDVFFKEQEGLRINFQIPPEEAKIKEIKNFPILKKELTNRSKMICFKCRIMYRTRKSFYCHIKSMHQECCNKRFNDLEMQIRHNFSHYNGDEKVGIHDEIKCLGCLHVYRNFQTLLSHSCQRRYFYKNKTVGSEAPEGKEIENVDEVEQDIDEVEQDAEEVEQYVEEVEQDAEEVEQDVKEERYLRPEEIKKEVDEEQSLCTIEVHESDSDSEPIDNQCHSTFKFVCQMCRMEFISNTILLQHIKTHI